MVEWFDGDNTRLYLLYDRCDGHIRVSRHVYTRLRQTARNLNLIIDEEVFELIPRVYSSADIQCSTFVNTSA